MLKKEEQVNSSRAPASTPCSQSRQTCSFVLGFIPLIGEPGCPLSGLVHARYSQGHGWYDSLALTDFLPGQGWSLGQLWGDGFECQRQPGSDSRTLTHLTGNCAPVFLFFPPPKPNSCLLYITLGAAYVDSFFPPKQLCWCSCLDMCGEKRSPAGSLGTPLYHPITMVLRQGHDQRDYS